jgi:hypothetical protein
MQALLCPNWFMKAAGAEAIRNGSPIELFTSTGDGQEFGAGGNINFFGNESPVPITPVTSGHAYYNRPSSGLPVNIFQQGPAAAVNDFRNPILGLDFRDGGLAVSMICRTGIWTSALRRTLEWRSALA